jgi:predicted pyridoxine 5'-phosphate oxidase superfamily flavin-nucleotide-binding protein
MGQTYDALDDKLTAWIERQPMFFVATAPLNGSGRVNVSPKGIRGTFRVLGPRRVAWLDFLGSGIETVAHLRENGRITLMFCAFAGPPKILRLYGRGRVVEPRDAGFADLVAGFAVEPDQVAERAVILVDVERIADSCGHGVPLMDYAGERDQHQRWMAQKAAKDGADWRAAYVRERNAESIDGLPGIEAEQFGGG